MKAAILSIGDELLCGRSTDTNAAWIAEQLTEYGIVLLRHVTVGDDIPSIASQLESLCGDADLILTTGGLGPTPDDLTREALACLCDPDAGLIEDPGCTYNQMTRG